MIGVIRSLAPDGMTVVIIEHTMHAMVRLARRLLVLDHGRVLAAGAPAEVTREPGGDRGLSRQEMDAGRCCRLTR